MKKVIAIVLALVMVLALAACGGTAAETTAAETTAAETTAAETTAAETTAEETTAAETTADDGHQAVDSTVLTEITAPKDTDVTVGICIYQFADNFMTLYRNDMEEYLKGLGVTNYTIVDGKNDQATQTEQIDTFIAQGVDVLIVNLVQSTAASTVIEKAKAADIPVVFINRQPTDEDMASYEKCTYVGADARQSGTYQGEIIAAQENMGDINGDGTVKYIMIEGDPENVDAQYRTEFSVKALEDAGAKVECLYDQRADWDQTKAQENVANALAQFGDDIEVVFCNNDAMALGALQALTAEGRTVGKDVYLVGVDALAEAVQNVIDGKQTGTVLNDDAGQAMRAIDCAMHFYNGDALESTYMVDYVKVTPDNAADYLG